MYVLSRIIGRPEIDSYHQPGAARLSLETQIQDVMTDYRPDYDPESQMDMNRYHSQWAASDDCWICGKYRYFIPVFVESEITSRNPIDTFSSEVDRELNNYFLHNDTKPSDLEPNQPYIVGSFTHRRIFKMKKVIEFMLALDPKKAEVIKKHYRVPYTHWGTEKLIQNYYKSQFFNFLEMYIPYKPFFDRILTSLVGQDDCMYVHNDFVKPGPHSYFIVVVNEKGQYIYKRHFLTFVKERKEDIEYRTLPVANLSSEHGPRLVESRYPDLIKGKWKQDYKSVYEDFNSHLTSIKTVEKFFKKE